jgi:hypothetical protein
MKITPIDIKSLTFACVLLSAVADQTLDERKRQEICRHKDRIRKMYLVLLNTWSQGNFDIEAAVHRGIADNSIVAKGIRSICPSIED